MTHELHPFVRNLALPALILFAQACSGQPEPCRGEAVDAATEALLPVADSWLDVGLVLDSGPAGSWDMILEGINPAAVVRRGDLFLLYYVGADDYIRDLNNIGPSHRALGVAHSPDGIRWTKHASNPVLRHSSSGNPEEGAVSGGVFVDASGVVHAYFGANSSSNPTTPRVTADLRYATSQDGFQFEVAGMAVDHADRTVWGHGDELHATLAGIWNDEIRVYYVPNGTLQQGKLGYCRGSLGGELDECGPVRSSGSPVHARGPASAVQLDADTTAWFVSHRGNLQAFLTRGDCAGELGPIVRSYEIGRSSIVILDRERRSWLLYYDRWSHIGMMVAPAGEPDRTPPSAPSDLVARFADAGRLQLEWSAAEDSQTGVLRYEIHRDGIALATSFSTSFVDSLLSPRNRHSYEIRAVNLHGIAGDAGRIEIETPADRSAPVLHALVATADGNVVLSFDEPVEVMRSTAIRVEGGPRIIRHDLSDDGRTLTLVTTPLQPDEVYRLTISELSDRSAHRNMAGIEREFTASATPELIVRWNMEDPARPGHDVSGMGHDGSAVGVLRATPGPHGRALAFEGDAYLDIAPSPALTAALEGDFTVSAWARPARRPPARRTDDREFTIFSAAGDLRLGYDDSGAFFAVVGWGDDEVRLGSQRSRADEWHHVALTRNHGERSLELYVDGVRVAKTRWQATNPPGWRRWESPNYAQYYARLRIGAHDPRFALQHYFFEGAIDELRIHAMALSPAQISLLAD